MSTTSFISGETMQIINFSKMSQNPGPRVSARVVAVILLVGALATLLRCKAKVHTKEALVSGSLESKDYESKTTQC